MKVKLRDYQKKDVKELKVELKGGNKHVLYGACTSYGKSVVIGHLVKKDVKNKKKVLVIAPRRKLVKQLTETLKHHAPNIIMGAGSSTTMGSNVSIASTATLSRRLKKHGKAYLGKLDKVYIDEAHINFDSPSMKQLVDLYWDKAVWVGFSATPIDERGYRLEGWDRTIYNNQVQDLLEMGMLTPVKVMVEETPEGLADVGKMGGDYNEKELSNFMNDAGKVANVFEIWLKYAKNRKTMIFAVTIQHAESIKEKFEVNGIKVAIVHSKMSEAEEEQHMLAFSNDEVTVMINVGKLSTGYDEPSVDCLLIARPTKSLRLMLQIWGRIYRLFKGKTEGLILDLAGNIQEHGYPTERRNFNLEKPSKKKGGEMLDTEHKCESCKVNFHMRDCKRTVKETEMETLTTWYCPSCNNLVNEKVEQKKLITKLVEVKDPSQVEAVSMEDLGEFVFAVQEYKGYKDGWVHFLGTKTTKNLEFRTHLMLLRNKWKMGMINLDTASTKLYKLNKDFD